MSSVSAWYLVYTKLKQEKIAQANLERQGYRVYLPFIQMQRHLKGRYQAVTEPMFPRYLFIYLNTETDDWGPIRSTRGVSTIVKFGNTPAKAPDELIDYLQQHEKNDAAKKMDSPEFYSGQPIRILSGAMAGYEGIFEAKTSAKRVNVLLDIVGRMTRVAISIHSVGQQ